MEKLPNNLKLKQSGVGPGGHPEFVRVTPEDDSNVTENTEDDFVLTPAEEEEFEKAEEELRKEKAEDDLEISEKELTAIEERSKAEEEEAVPGELKGKKRLPLRAFLLSLGIALVPMKDDGVDISNVSDKEGRLFSQAGLIDRNAEHHTGEFEKRVQEVAKMISSYDITETKEYADRRVVGAEDYTRSEYVAEQIKFTKWNEETGEGVPPVVEAELRRLLPGLCAQESRYDASRVSRSGARGILQIMPNNWKAYGGKLGEETSLVAQVEVAGRLFSDMYRQIQARLGDDVLSELKGHFSTEEAFQRDLMVPVLVNSYNAGDGRLADAVISYLHDTMPNDRPAGKDLFTKISDYAYKNQTGKLEGFSDHSMNYPYQVEAFAYHLDTKTKEPKRT